MTQKIKFWLTRTQFKDNEHRYDWILLTQGQEPEVKPDGSDNLNSSQYVCRFCESLFRKETGIDLKQGGVVELLSVKLQIRRLKKTYLAFRTGCRRR